jgi:hypothetical protein
MNFITNELLHQTGVVYTAAGTSTLTSAAVDMAGYEGAVCFAKFGTAAADNTLKAQQSSDDGSADAYADLLGTSVGVGASDETVFLDIKKPRERYLKFLALRGTSTTLEYMIVFKYGARSLPVDNTTAGTIHGEQHVSPAEGTA